MLTTEPRLVRNGPNCGDTVGFSVGIIQYFTFVEFWVIKLAYSFACSWMPFWVEHVQEEGCC